MCRLFGFRSVVPSALHHSLLDAENALGTQSERHPDGWGVAYYIDGAPHLVRSAETARTCQLFRRVSGIVASDTVIAHVRKATAGANSVLNSHPFQYGRWIFAHNGQIPEFPRVRPALLERLPEDLGRFVLGDTDSELMFMHFIDALRGQQGGLQDVALALSEVEARVEAASKEVVPPEELLLNFMVTDGEQMVASRRGKELYWSTHKTRCGERDVCPSFGEVCEAPRRSGFVNHLIVSSEPIGGENVWTPLGDGEAVAVTRDMVLAVGPLRRLGRGPALAVV